MEAGLASGIITNLGSESEATESICCQKIDIPGQVYTGILLYSIHTHLNLSYYSNLVFLCINNFV